ncbi:MAG: hypothetical protein P8Q92_12205 [Pseudoprimorskyibacter sp.]|nr:hypothetical protein [Pseudoprimorskyibacter sp.]
MKEIRRVLGIAVSIAFVMGLVIWGVRGTPVFGLSQSVVVWTDDVQGELEKALPPNLGPAPSLQPDLFSVRRSNLISEAEAFWGQDGEPLYSGELVDDRSQIEIANSGTVSLPNLGNVPSIDFSELLGAASYRELTPTGSSLSLTAPTTQAGSQPRPAPLNITADVSLEPLLRLHGFDLDRLEFALSRENLTKVEKFLWIPALRTAQSNPVVLKEQLNQIRKRFGFWPI